METIKSPLTPQLIADNINFHIAFFQHKYDSTYDTNNYPNGNQNLNELNRLKELSSEEKHNTDLYSKVSEVFNDDYKNNRLYEEDGKTFTNKSLEKALDLFCDYKIDEFVNTVVRENIDKANDMIHSGIKNKDDNLLHEARTLLNPNGQFLLDYENRNNPSVSAFRELCIKSRLSPDAILNEIKTGGVIRTYDTNDFKDFTNKFVPLARLNDKVYSINEHHKDSINLNAKGEALNTPNHLKTNKMETTNEKKETVTLAGNIGSISELKGTDKKFADISIAVNKPGEPADFKNVRLWEDTKGINDHTAKVGDFIKVEGYEKTLKNSKEEDYTVFNVTAITEFKPKETIKLTGNLGSDPEFKDVKGKQVATISIAVKGTDGVTEWKRIQMWEDKAEEAKGLKKGDTVTVEGREGKEYSYTNKNQEQVTAKDIIASVVEKHEKKSKEELNKDLISHAQKGDWEKVSDTLKKGADSKMVTEDHLKDLSPKQQDAIKNTIRSHEDFVAKKEGEKKNSSMKM